MSTNFDPTQNEIDRALASLGLTKKLAAQKEESEEVKLPSPSEIFSDVGAGVNEAAMTIATIMATANNSNMQLKAAEIALKVHGIFKDEDNKKVAPQVNINITASPGAENKTLVQVFMPTP